MQSSVPGQRWVWRPTAIVFLPLAVTLMAMVMNGVQGMAIGDGKGTTLDATVG
jgi:hypothetical protein